MVFKFNTLTHSSFHFCVLHVVSLYFYVIFFSQPDSSVTPVFDQFVVDGLVQDRFSMQLCSSSELDPSAEPTVAGTMVSNSTVTVCSTHVFPLWIVGFLQIFVIVRRIMIAFCRFSLLKRYQCFYWREVQFFSWIGPRILKAQNLFQKNCAA